MIEKTILDYLIRELSVPVVAEVPEDPPAEFVTVVKTGSSQKNHVYHALVALRSYAASLFAAAELNELVKEAMENAISEKNVMSARLNSDYNYTDPATKRYRYQAVYDIYYMEG